MNLKTNLLQNNLSAIVLTTILATGCSGSPNNFETEVKKKESSEEQYTINSKDLCEKIDDPLVVGYYAGVIDGIDCLYAVDKGGYCTLDLDLSEEQKIGLIDIGCNNVVDMAVYYNCPNIQEYTREKLIEMNHNNIGLDTILKIGQRLACAKNKIK